jgi:hypothetical protein
MIFHIVIENGILKKIYRANRKDGTGGWRKLDNEELRNLYSSPYIIEIKLGRMREAEHGARMGGMRNAYKILVG